MCPTGSLFLAARPSFFGSEADLGRRHKPRTDSTWSKGERGGGGATKKRRGQGRRVAVTEHRSNGVSRVATLTKHPSTTHGGSTRRQQGQHGDKKGRVWAEETLLLLLVLHGTCLGQSPSQVGRNDEDSSHHEMMQCPAPPTPSFSPDPLGRHRPRVCSCAQELLDSH